MCNTGRIKNIQKTFNSHLLDEMMVLDINNYDLDMCKHTKRSLVGGLFPQFNGGGINRLENYSRCYVES